VFILSIFLNYSQVNAGLFSFLTERQESKNDSEKSFLNSQTINLLETVFSPGFNCGKGGGDITIVNQNALLPDSGPMGTIADISKNKPGPDQISVYVVRKGDTLSEIAEMFNVSINTIRWANNLSAAESIKVGQILIILPVPGFQYTVKKGDTVKNIAKNFNADEEEILQFNNLAANEPLIESQKIIIPNADFTEPKQETPAAQKPKIQKVPSYSGYYLRPINGGRKTQDIHGYNGVDLADSCGAPVYASASGDVIISKNYGWNGGYGNYIVISHLNETQTLYAHLNQNMVSSGWHVAKGQIIGYMGTTGRSTGYHVHFEIRGGARNPF
jgi:murein DD-endopeptidase MepM/ murein hydrolase activator NlpD